MRPSPLLFACILFPGRPPVRAVAIYQVRNGLIQNVWFIS